MAPGGVNGASWPSNGRYRPLANPAPTAGANHQPLGGRLLSRGFGAYYLAVALVAAAGQVSAATHWSGWHLVGVIPLVAVLEFGGVVMAARADERRRKGERAYAALAIATAVALGAATINFAGHSAAEQSIAAWVFASLTLLGYAIWLVDTGYRRRDAMRASGMMRAGRPAYGWRWIRPRVTLLALEIWRKDQDRLRRERLAPESGVSVDESWALAKVARVTRREIRQGSGGGGGYADMSLTLYDTARVAQFAQAMVDHEGLARRIAERVSVDAIDAAIARAGAKRWWKPWTWRQASTRQAATPTVGTPPPADPPALAPTPATTNPAPSAKSGGERPHRRSAKRPGGGRQAPSMDQLVATLGERHPGERVSLPTASTTLRKAYGRCSDVRARAARDEHNKQLDKEADAA